MNKKHSKTYWKRKKHMLIEKRHWKHKIYMKNNVELKSKVAVIIIIGLHFGLDLFNLLIQLNSISKPPFSSSIHDFQNLKHKSKWICKRIKRVKIIRLEN